MIDGQHRLESARRKRVQVLPARRIRAEDHLRFITSVKSYEAYVRYWNQKIREGS